MRNPAILAVVACFGAATALGQSSFYVSADGDDSNDGSIALPFEHIQAAADVAQPGDTVFIRAGTYRETVALPRSGSAGSPIIFTGYNGEDVVISGGDEVTGWSFDSSATNGDIWTASVAWDMGPDGEGNTLFENGVLRFEAREGAEDDPMRLANWGQIASGKLQTTHFTASDLTGWGDDFWNGAKVRHHTHDWVVTNSEIADYRSSDGKVTFVTPFSVVSQKHVIGYYIYDSLLALDQPGEWYKDRGTDTLYYMVPNGQSPAGIEFKARDYGFDARGRDHIEIRELTFRGLHIRSDSGTDHNVYSGNHIYAYDKANYGRFWITGDNNVFRDNEVSQSWGSVVSIDGSGNQFVNNHLHDIGYNGTSRVITMSGEEHLVAYNTVRKFARSFLDGYPYRSEFKYNLFEDGANLSWDTGVFDGDSGRGNGGGCIVHHNVFRDHDPVGIYTSFYAGLDLVIHHNLIHDLETISLRSGQQQFLHYYHNTIIGSAPTGDTNASSYAFESSYCNNIQLQTDEIASIGVEHRGNHDYSSSDFVDFNGRDLRLAAGSGAIDKGVLLPGVNDGYSGAAPDAGALEEGEAMWAVGHDFASPPNPTYEWLQLPGTNLFQNPLFSEAPEGWSEVGTPEWFDGNAWNTVGTGLSRSGGRCFRLEPGDGISRTFTGLTPDRWYSISSETRLVDEVIEVESPDGQSGSHSTGSHRGEDYVEGLDEGEWLSYGAIDFGPAGTYDQLELAYSTPAGTPVGDRDATLEARLGGVGGTLLGVLDYNPNTADIWSTTQIDLTGVSGVHDVFLVPLGIGAGTMRLEAVRLQHSNPEPDSKLTVGVRNFGGSTVTTRVGTAHWLVGYESFRFKTGPSATSAELFVQNDGAYDAYFDRLAVFESDSGGTDLAGGGAAVQSSTTGGNSADLGIDAAGPTTVAVTDDVGGSWWQVDLGSAGNLHGIRLTAPASTPGRLSKVRVSVWASDPRDGGSPLWERDYHSAAVPEPGETIVLKANDVSADGTTELQDVAGRFVRLALPGQNLLATDTLAIADVEVLEFDELNLVDSDGIVSSGVDFWQVAFAQIVNPGEITLLNVSGAGYEELSNFTVSVWDRDPASGGSIVWQRDYFASGSVAEGGSFVVTGNETGADGSTRLASVLGRVIRVENNGVNAIGNTDLSLADAVVRSAADVKPSNNVALGGVAEQSSNHYFNWGFADAANNSVIQPEEDFTSTLGSESDSWWQVDLQQDRDIDQIVVYNRNDAASRIGSFRVSVWDGDPDGGGSTELWGGNYLYSAGDLPAGGSLTIDQNVTGARVVRVQHSGHSDILSLAEVQVWITDAVVRVDPAANSLSFDLGMADSPVASGWTRVSPYSSGDVWWDGVVQALDRGVIAGVNDINRDFVFGGAAAGLNVKVQDGSWDVTMNLGDAVDPRDDMMVWAEGSLIAADVDSDATTPFPYVSFTTTVSDGELNLQFDDNGGSDPEWTVTRVSLDRQLGGTAAIPGRIEAEDYGPDGDGVSFSDSTPGNAGGFYRSDDVDIEEATDAGGGFNVGWIVAGEFLTYPVDVQTTGLYRVSLRVASDGSNGVFALKLGGQTLATSAVPDSGGWQSWQTLTFDDVSLAAGAGQLLRLDAIGPSFNLNWMLFELTLSDDGDGLDDAWELAHFGDLTTSSGLPGEDYDGDGLDDGDEFSLGTDPTLTDSDGDGLSDGSEHHVHGSDPLDPDSDDDGYPDGVEANWGSSPTDGGEIPQLPGLIAYYPFEEGSGATAHDLATADGAQDAAQNQGTIGWTASGRVGGALDLPGNASLIAADAIPADATAFTMSVWISPDATGSYKGIYTGRQTGNWGLNFEDTNADFRFANASGSSQGVDSPDGSVVAGGGWHHLAITWQTDGINGVGVAYLDGVEIDTRTTIDEGIRLDYLSPSLGYFIGDDPCCSGREFNGRIDELAVFGTALSAADIARVHAAGLAGNSILTTILPTSVEWTDKGIVTTDSGGGTSAVLEWRSMEGFDYSIWKSTTLAPGSWVLHMSGISGAPGGVTAETVWVPEGRWFFRVRLDP